MGEDLPTVSLETMKLAVNQVRRNNEDSALAYFRIGVQSLSNQGFSQAELQTLTGIDKEHLGFAHRIAELFECDEARFLAAYRRKVHRNFRHFAREVLGAERRRKPPMRRTVRRLLDYVNQEISATLENPDLWPETERDLRAIVRKVGAFVPVEFGLWENSELKFSDCLVCGAHARIEGQVIAELDGTPPLPYPVCAACHDDGCEADIETVARFWYLYAGRCLDWAQKVKAYR